MTKHIYFDTSVVRHVGTACSDRHLDDALKERITVAPISIFEAVSQLCVINSLPILRQIHAIGHWVKRTGSALLPFPDDALESLWKQTAIEDAEFISRFQKMLNIVLSTDRDDLLRAEAGKFRDYMDGLSKRSADTLPELLKRARTEHLDEDTFLNIWADAIRRRSKASAGSKSPLEVKTLFSANFEFEKARLEVAVCSKDYNPHSPKNMNDFWDAEQLFYLASSELCFLTCDGGYRRAARSPQASRIFIVRPNELDSFDKVDSLLRRLTD
jgi:hypothetical protein